MNIPYRAIRPASNLSFYRTGKRLFDIGVSLTAILLLSPLFLIISILIRLDSRGPAIYVSRRVGENYRTFGIFKFRTMRQDADQQTDLMKQLNQYQRGNSTEAIDECPFCKMLGRNCSPVLYTDHGNLCENLYFMKKENASGASFIKILNDPRVTRLGKFLRKSSIDELPQLFNILFGHMSLVGNRPLPLYEAEKLTSDFAIARFNAPAGLTGLWQITQRGHADLSESERIELDKQYARECSFKTDFKIILKTFPALLQDTDV